MPQNKYSNPYADAYKPNSGVDVVKIAARIPASEIAKIRNIQVRPGLYETVFCTLWNKLVKTCYERNIISVNDLERFEQFVANLELTLPGETVDPTTGALCVSTASIPGVAKLHGSTLSVPHPQTSPSDERRGVDSDSVKMAHAKGLDTDVESGTKSGSRGRGRGKKG